MQIRGIDIANILPSLPYWLLGVIVFLFSLRLLIAFRYWLFPLPMTRFGFRGKFVYRDLGRNSHVFVSHRYRLSAKPDFVLKIGYNRYAIVEYKSANRPINEMDWWQVIVSVIAVRWRYNVREAYLVTSRGVYPVKEASWSTRKLYRKIKRHHVIAKRIKHKNVKPSKVNSENCSKCSKRKTCEYLAV